MMLPLVVFLFVVFVIVAGYAAVAWLPGAMERRRFGQRLQEVGPAAGEEDPTLLKERPAGPLPAFDKALAATKAGSQLALLIDQADAKTTPGGVIAMTIALGIGAAAAAAIFTPLQPLLAVPAFCIGAVLPMARLRRGRTVRLRQFEEQFPEALDLLSRALRAGHAFQTSLGMVASELPAPVGPEFKKTFDQQNFGLPLREAMNGLAERVPLLDVRFFVTAVAIQRDTGGNLSEILDNLAHVVRERFKIRRQVRVHTAHGRFTGYVLLALPAFLAVALSYIAPDQMTLLFYEPMGRIMVAGAIVLQAVGYFWIRQVIRIEV